MCPPLFSVSVASPMSEKLSLMWTHVYFCVWPYAEEGWFLVNLTFVSKVAFLVQMVWKLVKNLDYAFLSAKAYDFMNTLLKFAFLHIFRCLKKRKTHFKVHICPIFTSSTVYHASASFSIELTSNSTVEFEWLHAHVVNFGSF